MVKYGVLLALFALTFLLPGASKGWESVSMWWYLPMLAVALFLGVWIGKRRRDAREREQRRQEMENRPRDYAAGRRRRQEQEKVGRGKGLPKEGCVQAGCLPEGRRCRPVKRKRPRCAENA